MELFFLVIYVISILFIALYSLVQLHLLYLYKRSYRNIVSDKGTDSFDDQEAPFVSVQLPVYNELYVVERLIEAVAAFDYPNEKFEIQVLDDSTDETVGIIAGKVKEIRERGINITHFRRKERTGFKAGALQEGMQHLKGEFIAIFDADFVPSADFLKMTIPHFKDARTGVVQTRWGHLNPRYSILTRVQGFGLDAHFTVEQRGRNTGNYFINFNGTAGVWRKKCIEDAGGWQSDTLTEDLDLSYRAQLKGWQFKYLEEVCSPAELPVTMGALKSQQYRWTKGAAEVAIKILPSVLKAKMPFTRKLHAFFHLLNSSVYIFIILAGLSSVPLLDIKEKFPEYSGLYTYGTFFLFSMVIFGMVYFTAMKRHFTGNRAVWKEFSYMFPTFLSISLGISLHNAIAVVEGYIGRKTPFVRTPKFNVIHVKDNWKTNKYISRNISPAVFMEGLLALYFLYAIIHAIMIHNYGLLHFHLMLFAGFSYVFYLSFRHAKSA